MNPKKRKSFILEKVKREKSVYIDDLSKILNISPQSIRKDVNNLCRQGLLRREYGGATIPTNRENISYTNRQMLHFSEKNIIAKMIAKKIPDNSSLFFSIGTTPEIIAKALVKHKNLKIFTNNLNVALACCENTTFKITILGGEIRSKHHDILGFDIEKFFNSYFVDYGIFGVGAIEKDGTLLDFTQDELRARNAIKTNSKEVFLAADFSKFERVAYIRGGNITDVNSFFCDRKPPEFICSMLSKQKTPYFYPNSHENLQ